MKKLPILIALALMATTAFAQQRISDGTANAAINPDAVVEMQSNNKGLLLPRVALTGTANAAPLSAHVAGMHVYNIATIGDVKPGEYYNNGTKWERMVGASDLNVTVVNQTGSMPNGNYSSSSMANTGVSFNFLRAGTYIIKLQQSYTYISGCQDLLFRFSGATIVTQSVDEKKAMCGSPTGEWWTPIYYISVNGPGVVNLQYSVSTGTAVNLSIPGNTGNRAISIN